MTTMDGKSLDVAQQQVERLKALFPEAVTEGKIDWEKLKLTLGEEVVIANERYILNWAGKSDAFRAIQTQTTATLKPRSEPLMKNDDTDGFDKKKRNQRNHLISEISGSDNIFIEGENLEVLKVLQKSYYGKVKMIYIDPPYNTGNDSFIYPDKFSESKEEYLKRIGDKDEAGYLTKEGLFRKNSKESGQYHSNWLSMMYPRLFLARNLLRDDGVILVSIDDNEVHNLRLMMNEIFGEENFVASLIWRRRKTQANLAKTVAPVHDYLLCYGKDYSKIQLSRIPYSEEFIKRTFSNPDNDPRGPYQTGPLARPETSSNPEWELTLPNGRKIKARWSCSPETYERYVRENRIVVPREGEGMPRLKIFLSELEGRIPNTWLDEVASNDEASKEIEQIFGSMTYFTFPKPSKLIMHLMRIEGSAEGIILDFFAGSGTTAQAVLELNKEDGGNRKFILVQLAEKTEEDSEAYKAGYKTIADICKERIRRVIKKMSEPQMTADEDDENDNKEKQLKMELAQAERNQSLAKSHSSAVGFKSFVLEPSNFKIWRTDVIETEEDLKRQMEAFVDPVRKRSEATDPDGMAWEILLKSGYELTTKIEKITVGKVPLYSIANGEVMLALEKITQEAIDGILEKKPKKVICLDRLFARQTDGGQAGNDQLKTNTALQMKDVGVEFKTI